MKENGRVPLSPAIFVADHLRTGTIKAGIAIMPGLRFGFHSFRHSLAQCLAPKFGVSTKTVRSLLRHSCIQHRSIYIPWKIGMSRKRRKVRFSKRWG